MSHHFSTPLFDEQPATEIWKPIPGYFGYEVSDWGRVRSFRSRTGKGPMRTTAAFLKPSSNGRGYLSITLWNGSRLSGKTFYIHRLVLTVFVGPCPEGMEARHVGTNDRANNHLSNLCWGTKEENQEDRIWHGTDHRGSKHYATILDENMVREIRRLYRNGTRQYLLAKTFNQTRENILKIIQRKTWRHVED
jgi:hypothetical protein